MAGDLKVSKLVFQGVVYPPLLVSKIVNGVVLFAKNTVTLPPKFQLIRPRRRK